jgi:energy-coupling factor transporter ATP-binding protein EcfA2
VNQLRLTGVTLRYHGEARPALDDLTFAADPGRVHWLSGPLGAGCTTLLMAAAGLAPRYTGGELTGSVELLGLDPHADGGAALLAGRVAFVTATPALQLSGIAETVREEVSFAPANLGWPVARIEARVGAALEAFGIVDLAERDPRLLSGGETQRVVLAAMLALEPDVWLLDEAGSALDPDGRRLLGELVVAESRRGALVVVASEDVEGMAGVADRLVVLGEGRVVADTEPRGLLGSEAAWAFGLGSTGTAELARAAARVGGPPPEPTLAEPYPLFPDAAVARWTR